MKYMNYTAFGGYEKIWHRGVCITSSFIANSSQFFKISFQPGDGSHFCRFFFSFLGPGLILMPNIFCS